MNTSLRRLWRHYRHGQGLAYEILVALVWLLVGLIVMPCLICIAGRIKLGPYAHGGVFDLWRDFIAGLIAGSEAAWFVAVGPYLFVLFVRSGRRLLHN